MNGYDAIVLGTGGIGSAALMHLAARGLKVLGIDRFPPGHDRGSSHGQTRMLRQAYFENPAYVPLVLRSCALWRDLEQQCGKRLFYEAGLLQIGPADGEILPGVKRSAEVYGLELEDLTPMEVTRRFPALPVPGGSAAVFERRAGFLLVEECVVAHAEQAVHLGAELHAGEAVISWNAQGGRVQVETDRRRYEADRLIVTVGAWAGSLLADLAIPLTVLRKPLYWWAAASDAYRVERGCPGFLYETPEGIFYGFPQIDTRAVKVAEHSGGQIVDDPLLVSRELDAVDQGRVSQFIAKYQPELTTTCLDHCVCMYTMSPDANFVVDRHPAHPQVVFAAGLSGHGFKFAPVLGEILARLAMGEEPELDIGFLSCRREALS